MEGKFFGSDYLLGPKIGSGAMGTVYRAESRSTDDVFAIKILRPEHSSDRKRLTRFINEREALARVNHSNVVAIDDLVMEGDLFGIVMEFVDGGDLRDLLHETPMTEYQIVIFAEGMAAGLEAIHSAHIVHRDLKPENILVVERHGSFLPKVADFGIARLLDDSLTGTSGVSGTLRYMSPEVSDERFGDVGPPADMYSLGVILFELLTGEPPYTHSGPMQLLLAHAYDDVPHISGIDHELNNLVRSLLAKDMDDRPTVAELRYRLAEVRAYLESQGDTGLVGATIEVSHGSGVDAEVDFDEDAFEDGLEYGTDEIDVDVTQHGMVLVVGERSDASGQLEDSETDEHGKSEHGKSEHGTTGEVDVVSQLNRPGVLSKQPSGGGGFATNGQASREPNDSTAIDIFHPPRSRSEPGEFTVGLPGPGTIDKVEEVSDELEVAVPNTETNGSLGNGSFGATTTGGISRAKLESAARQTEFVSDVELEQVAGSGNPLPLTPKVSSVDESVNDEAARQLTLERDKDYAGEQRDSVIDVYGEPLENDDLSEIVNEASDDGEDDSVSEVGLEGGDRASGSRASIPQVSASNDAGKVDWRIIGIVAAVVCLMVIIGFVMFRLGSSSRGDTENVDATTLSGSLEVGDPSNDLPSDRNAGEGIGATANNTPDGPLAIEPSGDAASGGEGGSSLELSEDGATNENGSAQGTSTDTSDDQAVIVTSGDSAGSREDRDDTGSANDAQPSGVTAPGEVRDIQGIAGDKSITWKWVGPVDSGGAPIAYYIVTSATGDEETVETTQYDMTSLTNGTAYGVRVRACNEDRCGENSSLIRATPAAPPARPNSLTAVVVASGVDLGWNAPAFDGGSTVIAYEVSDGNSITSDLASTSFTWPTPAAWPAQFRVRACNSAGCGGWTPFETVDLGAATTLATPSNFTVDRANSAADLQWSPVSYNGANSVTYRIEGPGGEVRTTSQVKFEWAPLTNGFPYPFRVQACVTGSCGEWTEYEQVIPAGVPDAPTGLSLSSRTSDSIRLNWSEPPSNGADITKYQLERADFHSHDFSETRATIEEDLSPDRAYSFRVRACNPICGPPSDWLIVAAYEAG